jgi:hypothetical protein
MHGGGLFRCSMLTGHGLLLLRAHWRLQHPLVSLCSSTMAASPASPRSPTAADFPLLLAHATASSPLLPAPVAAVASPAAPSSRSGGGLPAAHSLRVCGRTAATSPRSRVASSDGDLSQVACGGGPAATSHRSCGGGPMSSSSLPTRRASHWRENCLVEGTRDGELGIETQVGPRG